MNEILKLVLSLSLSASLIALLLFALRPLYRERLSKRWQYYVWLVVVIRLLLPFSLELNLVGAAFDRTAQYAAEQAQPDHGGPSPEEERLLPLPWTGEGMEEQVLPVIQAEAPAVQEGPGMLASLADSLWLIWLGVAVVLLARKVTNYQSFARFIKAGREPVADPQALEVYRQACDSVGVSKPVPLYRNKLAASPMLVGILRPCIVLPQLDVGPEELCLVLRHELIHYKRRDILYKWLLQIALCIHWFNPAVYLVARYVNRDCELSCDEALIGRLPRDGQRQYGDTLLATIKAGGGYNEAVASVTLSEDGKQLKERLRAILQFKAGSRWAKAGAAAMTVLLLCMAAFAGAYAGVSNVVRSSAAAQQAITIPTLSSSAYTYLAGVQRGDAAQVAFQSKKDNTVLYFDLQGSGAFQLRVRDNKTGLDAVYQDSLRFGDGEEPTITFSSGNSSYTLEIVSPKNGPDTIRVYGASVSRGKSAETLSLPDLPDTLAGGIAGRVVEDTLNAVFSGKSWRDWEDWALEYGEMWERWADAWEEKWDNQWDREWGAYWDKYNSTGNGDSWYNLEYKYDQGYLVGAGIRNNGSLDAYQVTRQMTVGGTAYTVAFESQCASYADDATAQAIIRELLEKVLSNNRMRSNFQPTFFTVRDIHYNADPVAMMNTLYDDKNMIGFMEVVGACGDQPQALESMLERTFQDGSDIYFLFVADELPGNFDAADLARRVAEKQNVVMLSALERFLPQDTYEELMAVCLNLPPLP